MARLALVMVARGEIDLVERALRSAEPFVDDMLVYDLGSTAKERGRLTDLGAHVVEGSWSDDAAACRNAALEAADADWSVVLDPEEWIAEGGAALRSFVDGAERVGLVEVRRAPGGAHAADHPRHLAPRILPRGVRYQGAWREEPVFDLPVERSSAIVVSDDTETGRWRADRERTEALLLQALAVRPGDPGLLLQLADELRVAGRHADAARRYAEALESVPPADDRRHALVVGALESYTKCSSFREAVALMDEQSVTWQHSPDFAFLVGDLFFEMMLTMPQLMGELAPLVEASWKKCLDLGERPDLAGAVHGRGSFLAAQNLYVLCLVLGRGEEAETWCGRAAAMRIPASSVGRIIG